MRFQRGKCYVSTDNGGSVLHVTSERRCSSRTKRKKGGMMIDLEGPSSGWYNDKDKKKNKKQQRQQRLKERKRRTKEELEQEHLQQVNQDFPQLQYHRLEALIGNEFVSKKCNNVNDDDYDNLDQKKKKGKKTNEKIIEFGERFVPTVYNPYPTDFELPHKSSKALRYVLEGITTYCQQQYCHQYQYQQQQQRSAFIFKLNFCSFNGHLINILDVANRRQLISTLQVEGSTLKNFNLIHISSWMKFNPTLHTIDLRCYYWTRQFHNIGIPNEFIRALSDTTTLFNLRVHIPCLDHDSLSDLITGISNNKSLKSLSLMVQWQSVQQFEIFLSALLNHPNIVELRFENSIPQVFTFSWITSMSKFLSSKRCKISTLDISGLCLAPDDLDTILSSLWDGHPMRHLDVSDNNKTINLTFPRFLSLESVTKKIERIEFSENRYTISNMHHHHHHHYEDRERDINQVSESLCAILEKCPKLHTNFEYQSIEGSSSSSSSISPSLPSSSSELSNKINFLLDRNLINRTRNDNETLPYESLPICLWPDFFGRKINDTIPTMKRQADQIYRLLLRDGTFLHLLNGNKNQIISNTRNKNNKRRSVVSRNINHHRHRNNLSSRYARQWKSINGTCKQSLSTSCDDHRHNDLTIIEYKCNKYQRKFQIVCHASKLKKYLSNRDFAARDEDDNDNGTDTILETDRIFTNIQKHIIAEPNVLYQSFGMTDIQKIIHTYFLQEKNNRYKDNNNKKNDKK